MHSEIDEAEIPSGTAVFGSDDATGACFMLYFDERGVALPLSTTEPAEYRSRHACPRYCRG